MYLSPGMPLLFFLESPPVRLCDPYSVRGFLLRPLTPRVTGHFLVFILPDGTAGPAASRPPAHWRDARGSPLSRYLLVLLLPSPLLARVPALSSSVGVPGSSLGPPFFLWLASALGVSSRLRVLYVLPQAGAPCLSAAQNLLLLFHLVHSAAYLSLHNERTQS